MHVEEFQLGHRCCVLYNRQHSQQQTSEIAVFLLTGGEGDNTSTGCADDITAFGGKLPDSDDTVLVGKIDNRCCNT